MFLIKLNDDNIVTNVNGINITFGIKSNDKLAINKAILLSIAAKPIKEKYGESKKIYIHPSIGKISLHDVNKTLMYISNGWCWYGIAKFENIFENKYDIEKYLSSNILKEKCLLTKKLYYCLINNSSVSHYYSDLYPLLSEHFANEYDK